MKYSKLTPVHSRLILLCAGFILSCMLCESDAQEWEIETVEEGREFLYNTDRSMQVDEMGNTHIVYGNDHLYYARYDGVSLDLNTADSGSHVGSHASLAIDSVGSPHIGYYDAQNTALKYAFLSDTGWQNEIVDNNGFVGKFTSIVLDDSGFPHISYRDFGLEDLKYAKLDATGWHIYTIDSADNVGTHTSIAIDKAGYIHISYFDNTNDDLKYAYENATGWSVVTIDSSGIAGEYNSLALDSLGFPHISYSDMTRYDLKYAFADEEGWHVNSFLSPVDDGVCCSISLDSYNYPHMSSASDFDLTYTYKDAARWHVETIDSANLSQFPKFTSIVRDESGNTRIAYSESRGSYFYGIRCAFKNDPDWDIITIDEPHKISGQTSLVIDGAGFPYIGYEEQITSRPRLAISDGTTWFFEELDFTSRDFGAMALDDLGFPHMVIMHSMESVTYLYKDETGWNSEVVFELLGDTGSITSLCVDSENYSHFTYDYSYVSLRDWHISYLFKDETGWHENSVDGNGDRYTSLVLDNDGLPHISYLGSGAFTGLKYACKDASGVWHRCDVCSGYLFDTSIDLDEQELPHIAFCYDTGLKYAWCDSSGDGGRQWHVQTVDSESARYVSLKLDSDGYPHISYRNYTNHDLRYAFEDEDGWYIQTVDSFGNVGWWSSLALDGFDQPHISYVDYGNSDLKYAHLAIATPMTLSCEVMAGQLSMMWSAVENTNQYWIYGASNLPWFVPGFSPNYEYRLVVLPGGTTTWSSSSGLGEPDNDWTYQVIAVDESESEIDHSNRVGEQDFEADIP